MKLSIRCPKVASMSWSMLGSGYESFGHVTFSSIYTTHILHFLLGFLTRTMLATQFEYFTSQMMPAFRYFSTSSSIAFCLSGVKFRLFYLTGFFFGFTSSRCMARDSWISSMSSGPHMNTSTYSLNSWVGSFLNTESRSFLVLTVFPVSPSTNYFFGVSFLWLKGLASAIANALL